MAIWRKRGPERLKSESDALQRERLAARVKLDAFVMLLSAELETQERPDDDRPIQRRRPTGQ